MKYCPYCGSDLVDTDVLFCSECGKKLSGKEKQTSVAKKPEKKSKKKGNTRQKQKTSSIKAVQQSDNEPEDSVSKADEGYDGYYDDVQPADEGNHREGIDKELMKKILLLAVGVLVIVGICVAFMYLV